MAKKAKPAKAERATPARLQELQGKLAEAQLEVRNSHILISALAARMHGLVALTDQEITNISAMGQLTIMRDDRVPGCIIMVRPKAQPDQSVQ